MSFRGACRNDNYCEVLNFLINGGVAEASTGTIFFWIGGNSKND